MTIYRIETTIIPQTIEGRKFAAEYEERLRNQGDSMPEMMTRKPSILRQDINSI